MNAVTQTLTLRSLDGDALDEAMAAALRERGYTVLAPGTQRLAVTGKWERPSKLAARLGLHPGSLSRTLARPDCPKPQAEARGLRHRLVSLVSTPELDAYLTRHKE